MPALGDHKDSQERHCHSLGKLTLLTFVSIANRSHMRRGRTRKASKTHCDHAFCLVLHQRTSRFPQQLSRASKQDSPLNL